MNIEQTTPAYGDVRGAAHPSPGALDARAVLELFGSHLGKISFCTIAAVGLGYLYLTVTRPYYTSQALLEVAQSPRSAQYATEVDSLDNLKTIELKLASQPVLLGVVQAGHLVSDPAYLPAPAPAYLPDSDFGRWLAASGKDFLQLIRADRFLALADPASAAPAEDISESALARYLGTHVSAKVVRGSRLISLSAEAHAPAKAQELAQAVLDEFFRQSRNDRQRDSASSRDQLLAEAKRVGDELRISEEKLEAYRKEYNAVSLQERQNIVVERLRELNQQVAAAKNARLALETEQELARRLAASAPDELLSIRTIAEYPEIIDLRKQVALQEAQLATLAQRFGPLHPTMIQGRSQLDELKSALRTALRGASDRLLQTYGAAKAKEAALESSLADQEKTALELDRIAIPYHNLERDAQSNAGAYQKILDELKQADVSHGLVTDSDVNGSDIRVVESPPLPSQPTRPQRSLLLGLALTAGLFVGSGLALLSHALENSIVSVDEAESYSGLPVLASVPRSRHHRLGAHPLVLRFPASAAAEAFRSLRTGLSLLGSEEARRCILFTSAVPGEGKSFCALNCAAALAQQGLRTLLIDADLRRPTLLWHFGEPFGEPELSDVLGDPALFPKAVQPTEIEHLHRLGDWNHRQGSAELLARGGFREIVRQGLAAYDRIVIDSAPLLAVSDSLIIARHVPTVCVVAAARRTPRRFVRRALRLLEEVSQRRATGLVLNKTSSRTSADHYYYYKS